MDENLTKTCPNVALPKQENLHISCRIVQIFLLHTHKMYDILMLLVISNIHVFCQLSGLFADHRNVLCAQPQWVPPPEMSPNTEDHRNERIRNRYISPENLST